MRECSVPRVASVSSLISINTVWFNRDSKHFSACRWRREYITLMLRGGTRRSCFQRDRKMLMMMKPLSWSHCLIPTLSYSVVSHGWLSFVLTCSCWFSFSALKRIGYKDVVFRFRSERRNSRETPMFSPRPLRRQIMFKPSFLCRMQFFKSWIVGFWEWECCYSYYLYKWKKMPQYYWVTQLVKNTVPFLNSAGRREPYVLGLCVRVAVQSTNLSPRLVSY